MNEEEKAIELFKKFFESKKTIKRQQGVYGFYSVSIIDNEACKIATCTLSCNPYPEQVLSAKLITPYFDGKISNEDGKILRDLFLGHKGDLEFTQDDLIKLL